MNVQATVAKPGLYRRRVGRGHGGDDEMIHPASSGFMPVDAGLATTQRPTQTSRSAPDWLHASGCQVWQLHSAPHKPAARPPSGFMPVDARFEN